MLAEFRTAQHADDRLAQHAFMAADDSVGGVAAVGGCVCQLLARQCFDRYFLHDCYFMPMTAAPSIC